MRFPPRSCYAALSAWCLSVAGISQPRASDIPDIRPCRTGEVMDGFYQDHPEERHLRDLFELEDHAPERAGGAPDCFVIPVVFHVYGQVQTGYPVNGSIIDGALAIVHQDFHATNPDYDDVHTAFLGIRGAMPDILFVRAQLDPDGQPTNGIVYHPVASGYGNLTPAANAAVAADAWDNGRYMNIYIMEDLYGDGVTTNSGLTTYPSTTLSNGDLDRVVYNGNSLGVNTAAWGYPEFASELSHEFGHWLNLYHTFEDGCTEPNDHVADTPPCDYFQAHYGCHSSPTANNPINCHGDLINSENYMDYSSTFNCMLMFTQGQVTRMYNGLYHPARFPLWQPANLTATGLAGICATATGIGGANLRDVRVFPNPATDRLTVQGLRTSPAVASIVDLLGHTVARVPVVSGAVDITALAPGVYGLSMDEGSRPARVLFVKQ